ncbi:MAG: hypothetical protein EA402_08935 [Planctomycetota bacterium]|nr:MAG: hypothetical protein EA402_08935 [Planctomycetota bacterium]
MLFFCCREVFPIILKPEGSDYQWGKSLVVADTSASHAQSVTISAVGSLVAQALKAVDSLAAQGIGAVVLANSLVNRPDIAGHQAALKKTGNRLITLEDHQAIGGAGSMLLSALVQAGSCPQVKVLGVQSDFGRSAYTANELYAHYGIDAAAVVTAAKALV